MRAPLPLFDSHAHLSVPPLAHELDQVLARARGANVTAVINVGMNVVSSQRALEQGRTHADLFATAGIHPYDSGAFADDDWALLEAMWQDPGCCAVGETGLDYTYEVPPARQRQLFERHLDAGRRHALPVIIHLRSAAFADAFAMLRNADLSAGGAVIHCFSGGRAEVEIATELGLYLSLAGLVTYPAAKELQGAVPHIARDRLLVETDSPYLAPAPLRGQRNEPAYMARTSHHVAQLMGWSWDELCAQTRRNTLALFRRCGSDAGGSAG